MQYIFSRILCRALDARKYNVSENCNHNRTNKIDWYVHGNLTTQYAVKGLMRQNLTAQEYLGLQYTNVLAKPDIS